MSTKKLKLHKPLFEVRSKPVEKLQIVDQNGDKD